VGDKVKKPHNRYGVCISSFPKSQACGMMDMLEMRTRLMTRTSTIRNIGVD